VGFFDLFRKKDDNQHELTELNRDIGRERQMTRAVLLNKKRELEIARLELEHERDKLKIEYETEKLRQDLDDLRGDDYDDSDGNTGGSTEDALLAMLISKMGGGAHVQQQPAPPIPAYQEPKIDEEQLKAVWRSLTKREQQIAKKMPDSQLKAIINARAPNISEGDLDAAVDFVRKV